MSDETPPPAGEMTTIEFLALHPLFWELTKEDIPSGLERTSTAAHAAVRDLVKNRPKDCPELIALNKVAEEFTFKKGAILAHQNEYADRIHILRDGRLETQYTRLVDTEDGGKKQAYVRHALHMRGAVVEDIWIFTKQLYPYYIKASTDGKIILISREKFLGYLKDHPRALRLMFPHFSPDSQEIIKQSRFQEYLNSGGWWQNLRSFLPQRRSQRATEDAIAQEFDPRLARLHRKFELAPEESIQFQSQRSPWILLPYLILPTAMLIGVLLVGWFFAAALGAMADTLWFRIVYWLAVAFPVGLAILQYIDWANDWFLVTDNQIIQYEFELFRFRKQVEKISIDKVQSTEVETPNFFAKVLNLGTVRITTAAQAEVILFDFITQPKDVEVAINRVRDQDRSVAMAKTRRTMRHAAESYLSVPDTYTQIKYVEPKEPNWIKDNWNRLTDVFTTFSHRSEKNGVVTYHKHRITLLGAVAPPLMMFVVLWLIWYLLRFFAGITFDNPLGIVVISILMAVNGGLFIWQVLDWLNDTYQITGQYVIDIDRAPFGFRESRKQAELSRVENVRTEQFGLISNIFDYGLVYVETAGATSSIVFENVANPNSIQSDLFKKLDDFRKKQEEASANQRRMEFSLFMDQYDKTRKLEELPEYEPLLREDEEGLPPE